MRLVDIAPTNDAVTGLPVVVIDTTALNGTLPTESQFNTALGYLPQQDHIVVFFASGAPKTPNLPWLIQSHKLLSRETKKRIRKVYVVHGTWWSKAAINLLGGVLSPKFVNKVHHVKSISALARDLDVTVLNISPLVYLANLKVESCITVPKHCERSFGLPVDTPRSANIYTGCLRYLTRLDASLYPENAFERTNGAALMPVLVEAVQRGQLVDLSAFGPQLVIALLKFYLLELPVPVLDIAVVHTYGRSSPARLVDAVQHPNRRALGAVLDWLADLHKRSGFKCQQMAESIGPALAQISIQGPAKDLAAIKIATAALISDWPLASPMAEKPASSLNAANALKSVPNLAPISPRKPFAPAMVGRSRSQSPTRSFNVQPLGERPATSDNRQPLPKANMAAIRGTKIAQMVRTFEDRLEEM